VQTFDESYSRVSAVCIANLSPVTAFFIVGVPFCYVMQLQLEILREYLVITTGN